MNALYEIIFNAPSDFTRGFIMGLIGGKKITGEMMLIPDNRIFTSNYMKLPSMFNLTHFLIGESLLSNLHTLLKNCIRIESIHQIKLAQFAFFVSSNKKQEPSLVTVFANPPLGINVHYFKMINKNEKRIDMVTSTSEYTFQGMIEGNSSSVINFCEDLIEKYNLELWSIKLEYKSVNITCDDYCID